MIQWLCYWLVFATLHIAECLLFSIGVLGFIPFYNEVHTTTAATCRSAVLRGTPACRRAGLNFPDPGHSNCLLRCRSSSVSAPLCCAALDQNISLSVVTATSIPGERVSPSLQPWLISGLSHTVLCRGRSTYTSFS